MRGEKLKGRMRIDKTLFEFYNVEIPISAFLSDDEDNNYTKVKEALRSMSRKAFEFEDAREWRLIQLIIAPKIGKYESIVKFTLHQDIYDALLNFSKGYKKFELKTAFEFKSVYTMRFYELFSKQNTPLVYSVDNLKLMFGVQKKYKDTRNFIIRVVDAAKQELDEKSPYSFEYTPLKTGRKITSIKFYPVLRPQNVNPEYEAAQLKKLISPSLMIKDNMIRMYLKEHYMFSTPELKNNIDLFMMAEKQIPDLLMFLSEVKAKANRAGNPKGYLINALRKKMKISTTKNKTAV
jgi:hypothetical protein